MADPVDPVLSPDDEASATAAELALGLLEGPERAAAVRRVLAEPRFAAEVERWRERFAPLFALWPERAPPPGLFDRLERSIDDRRVSPVPAAPGRWSLRSAAAGLVAGALAAGAAFLAIGLPRDQAPVVLPQPAPLPLVAALAGDAVSDRALLAAFDDGTGQLRFLSPVPRRRGRSLQAWAIGGDGVPRSLGLVSGPVSRPAEDGRRSDVRGAVAVARERRALVVPGVTLAVSDEPSGGSPGALPSGPVLATGALVRL